jgi:hypothetical protein
MKDNDTPRLVRYLLVADATHDHERLRVVQKIIENMN